MKKLLSLVLAALLIVAALTPALAESPVEITVLFEGCNVTDDTAVLEKLNAYLAEKIGVTVKPVWGTWANFNDLASNAINAGSDEYDVMFTCSWTSNEYAPYAKKGVWTTRKTTCWTSTARTWKPLCLPCCWKAPRPRAKTAKRASTPSPASRISLP